MKICFAKLPFFDSDFSQTFFVSPEFGEKFVFEFELRLNRFILPCSFDVVLFVAYFCKQIKLLYEVTKY